MTSDHKLPKEHKINTIKEAQKEWADFYARYHLHLPTVSDEKKPITDTEEFIYFLNGQDVEQSIDSKKIQLLKNELNKMKLGKRNERHGIFQDKELPYLTMALYKAGEISAHQCFSLLEYRQTAKNFRVKGTYPLLSKDKKSLSADARKYLLPELNKTKLYKPIVGETENEWCLRIAVLPWSEQFFTIHENDFRELKSLGSQLTGSLLTTGDLLYDARTQNIVSLSAGARDALGLVRFGGDHVMVRPRLGAQTIKDYEHVPELGFWPTAVDYPGTIPFGDIHGHKNISCFEAHVHDINHAGIWARTPKNIRSALSLVKNTISGTFDLPISKKHNLKLSKEILEYIDHDSEVIVSEEYAALDKTKFTSVESTELFSSILKQVSYNMAMSYQGRHAGRYFVMKDGGLTSVGAALFISMVENPKQWLDLDIDPNQLTRPFLQYYQGIKANWDPIKNDNKKLMIINCQIYFALKAKGLERHFSSFSKIFADPENHLEIVFGKLSPAQAKKAGTHKNTIYSEVLGQELLSQKQIMNMVNTVLELPGHAKYRKEFTTPLPRPRRKLCISRVWSKPQNSQPQAISYNPHASLPTRATTEQFTQVKFFGPRKQLHPIKSTSKVAPAA